MTVTRERVQKLREFGLTESAARAYLALLDLGVAQAGDISTLSRVPTSKIYHVLDQLHERGLVEILPEFPRQYAPLPLDNFLQKLQQNHEEAAARIARERAHAEAAFRALGGGSVSSSTSGFAIVRSRRNVIGKMMELLASAQSDYLVVGSRGASRRLLHALDDLRRASARGVRLRILLPIDASAAGALATLSKAVDVRERAHPGAAEGSDVTISIADGARAILACFAPDDDNVHQGKDTAIFIEQPSIAAAIRSLAEAQWSVARKASFPNIRSLTPAP